MKYAIVNDKREEAKKKGLIAYCPCCGGTVISKCGNIRSYHWAHEKKTNCDTWWENETDWHRNWKDKFPKDWQEKIFKDNLSGEKHIADICTDSNLVIEFQHSSIKPEERLSREHFYRKMIWVVDGTKLKECHKNIFNLCMELDSDLERYSKFYNIIDDEHSIYTSKEIKFIPNAWRKSNFPVLFDFSEVDNYIYCIIPPELNKSFFITKIKKGSFIKDIIENNISYFDDYINRTRQNSEYIKQYKNMY